MNKKYEEPLVFVLSVCGGNNFCLSGDGTENVGKKSVELTDDDFE